MPKRGNEEDEIREIHESPAKKPRMSLQNILSAKVNKYFL